MATKPETTFYRSVHQYLPPLLHREKLSSPYTSGTADFWFSGHRSDLWIEYKFLLLPKGDDTMVDLTEGKDPHISVLQQRWLRQRHEEGRKVWVIVGCKEGGIIFQGTSWNRGPFPARWLRHRMLTRRECAAHILDVVGAPS